MNVRASESDVLKAFAIFWLVATVAGYLLSRGLRLGLTALGAQGSAARLMVLATTFVVGLCVSYFVFRWVCLRFVIADDRRARSVDDTTLKTFD